MRKHAENEIGIISQGESALEPPSLGVRIAVAIETNPQDFAYSDLELYSMATRMAALAENGHR